MSPQTKEHWIALAVVILSQKTEKELIQMIDDQFDVAFMTSKPGMHRDILTCAFCTEETAKTLAKSLIA